MVKAQNRVEVSRRVRDRIGELGRSGISQANIAKRLGLNTRTVERWRSGEVVPTQANRSRLYGLYGRLAFPRDITSRVERNVIVNGKYAKPPLFKTPVSTGKVPTYWDGQKVYGGYVVVNVFIQFDDGESNYMTQTIGGRIPPNTRLDNKLVFDGIEAEWRLQLKKIDDSRRILNYWVEFATIKLVGYEIKW